VQQPVAQLFEPPSDHMPASRTTSAPASTPGLVISFDLDRDQPGLVCWPPPSPSTCCAARLLCLYGPLASADQNPALPAAAHRRPHRPRPAQTQDPHPRKPGPGHRAHPAPLDQPRPPNSRIKPDRGTRRPPDATAGRSTPPTPSTNKRKINTEPNQARPSPTRMIEARPAIAAK